MRNKGNLPLLTVGIPTFNGEPYIRETIESVIEQIEMTNKVEILISDNASTDRTPEIISEYTRKYKFIRYFRNQKNTGFDRNVDLVFERAKGEFVWILSDDDRFRQGAIRKVLNVLDKHRNISVIFVNYAECDANMNEYPIRIRPDLYKDVYCENGDTFFKKSKFLFGLVSSLIIRRKKWDERVKKYIGSGFIHVGAIIEILSKGQAYIISDKLVDLRTPATGEERWQREGYFAMVKPGFELVKIFKKMEILGYRKETKLGLIDNMYRANLRLIFTLHLMGVRNKGKVAKEMIECYGRYPTFWLIHLPFLFIPSGFFRVLRKIKRFLKNIVRWYR